MDTSRDAYDAAIERFCELNRGSQIYLAGEISHPGISDLDFVIIDDEPVIDEFVRPFLCGGNVLVVPREIFPKIDMIERFGLHHINGECTERVRLTRSAAAYMDTIETIEWLPERILRTRASAGCDSRQLQLLAKSLARSISGAAIAMGRAPYELPVGIDDLRARASITHGMIMPNVELAHEVWEDFEEHPTPILGRAAGSVDIAPHYRFESQFNKLLLYLAAVLDIDCELSARLGARVDIDVHELYIDPKFRNFVHERWRLIDEMHGLLRARGITAGAMKWGWLL